MSFSIRKIKTFFKSQLVRCSKDRRVITPDFLEYNKELIRDSYTYPKIIWIYWHCEVNIPDVVNLAVNRVRHFCPDFQVNFINQLTISKYLNDIIIPLNLPQAIKADYIRLKLLSTYGGVWMDSSIFLNENLDWIFDRLKNHDAFVFYSDECTTDIENPITENWFIIAPANSLFINSWLNEFTLCIFSSNPTAYYNNIKYDKNIVQNLTKVDYLLCYISAIKVLMDFDFKILYSSSSSSGHYFNYLHGFNGELVATELTMKSDENIPKVKLIKLNSGSRNAVQKAINAGHYLPNSYIGKLYLS